MDRRVEQRDSSAQVRIPLRPGRRPHRQSRGQRPRGQQLPSCSLHRSTATSWRLVASRLGLTVHEMSASVEIVTQQQMQEQGYRTTTEAAQGAVGVLSGDLGGAPASFSMRGFTGAQVGILYNGIWTGPGDYHVPA